MRNGDDSLDNSALPEILNICIISKVWDTDETDHFLRFMGLQRHIKCGRVQVPRLIVDCTPLLLLAVLVRTSTGDSVYRRDALTT